ncbi:MAG: hypothetical protein ACP5MD_15885 [Verrucomicrobiia bacterium]
MAWLICARAQYSIAWSTMAGGGGTSTGGVFSVTGTAGQADAGQMSGGDYVLTGGFWSFPEEPQSPIAPVLAVALGDGSVVLSWPWPSPGWVLEATNSLPSVSIDWPEVPPPYETNGPNLQYIEPAPAGTRFYRLHKP